MYMQITHHDQAEVLEKHSTLAYAVFRLEYATEVLELTYPGKYFPCVNANWYPGKHRSRQ